MPDKIAEVTLDELVWDSEFWGESAARIRLGEVSASRARVRDAIHSAQADFDFVQMLVPVGQIQHAQEAERAGFLVVDVRAEVALERGDYLAGQDPDGSFRIVLASEIGLVAELASTQHAGSRFGSDPYLDPRRTTEFYRRWMHRDVALPGWTVLVAESDGVIEGYVSFGPSAEGNGTIGLIGVAPAARGAGVGRRLVARAASELFDAGSSRISVITQAGNAPAMRLYQSCGFTVSRLGFWMHWHREPRRPVPA